LLKFGLPSMSPKCPNNPLQSDFTHLHLGTETSRHISGWCIVLKRSLWYSIFGFDDGVIEPELGQAWWFDNSNVHWVDNKTDSDRIAMIVCIRTEKYKDKNAHRI